MEVSTTIEKDLRTDIHGLEGVVTHETTAGSNTASDCAVEKLVTIGRIGMQESAGEEGAVVNDVGNAKLEQDTTERQATMTVEAGESDQQGSDHTDTTADYDHEDTLRRLDHINKCLNSRCMTIGYELDTLEEEEALRATDNRDRDRESMLSRYEWIKRWIRAMEIEGTNATKATPRKTQTTGYSKMMCSMYEDTGKIDTDRLEAMSNRLSLLVQKHRQHKTELKVEQLKTLMVETEKVAQGVFEQKDVLDECGKSKTWTNRFCTSNEKELGDTHLPLSHKPSMDRFYTWVDKSDIRRMCNETTQTEEQHMDDGIPRRSQHHSIYKLSPQRSSYTNGHLRYQSMQAELNIASELDEVIQLTAVVDSGAAWSAISSACARQLFPKTYQQIRSPGDHTFVDASDRPMPVEGILDLYVCVGQHCFWTQVFVFPKLGVSFLLGVNSLVDGDLIIHGSQQRLYKADEMLSGGIALRTHRGPATCGGNCRHSDCARVNLCTTCQIEEPDAVIADLRAKQLTFRTSEKEYQIACKEIDTEQAIPELTVPVDQFPMTALRTIHIPPAKAGRPTIQHIPLVFQEWTAGPETTVEIVPAKTLSRLGLECAETTYHSSFNIPNNSILPRSRILP